MNLTVAEPPTETGRFTFRGVVIAFKGWSWSPAGTTSGNTANDQSSPFRFLVLSNSQPEELDSQGRIVIPPEYLREAGLSRDVVIIGVNDRIELWNPEAYDRRQAETEENYQQMIKLF